METPVFVAALTASSAVVVATLGYLFTKSRDREVDWRKLKIEHYRELLTAISGIVKGNESSEGPKRFAMACNVVALVASQDVLLALRSFQDIVAKNRSPQPTSEEHDQVLVEMLLAIRRDLKLFPKDDAQTFRFSLWASGVGIDKPERSVQ